MNIFVLDSDPRIAAQAQCDKHVVKMVLETAQILSTVAASRGISTRYRPTHASHPCTLWAGLSGANWRWILAHGQALAEEYSLRYGRAHASSAVIEELAHSVECDAFEQQEQTPFAQAMPDEYKNPCAVTAYRAYYRGAKADICRWTVRAAPDWFLQ
jgi:hypothetical protein